MAKPDKYSLSVVCRPSQLCDFDVYIPGHDPMPKKDIHGDIDLRWQQGFGMPVLGMRGFTTTLTAEEQRLKPLTPNKEEQWLETAGIYNRHPFYSHRAATGEAGMVIDAANSFLENHRLIGELEVDMERIGDLGALALATPDNVSEEGFFIPSPALATAMGQLPMSHVALGQR